MFIRIFRLAATVLLMGLVSSAHASYSDKCEKSNSTLESMKTVEISFLLSDGSHKKAKALLADSVKTRAAGFQNICQSTVDKTLILFTFEHAHEPSFHMHNVVASLDIAFIKRDGAIESIQLMKPYSLIALDKPLYSPNEPVVAALEGHQGFFKEHGVASGDLVKWKVISSD